MREDYHNYNELTEFMQEIANNYPDITSLESIGKSVEGRELWVMEISDNPGVNEIEPEFKYIANMHGNETVGRELSLYLIEWLVENYDSDTRATDLVNNTAIYILPSMNPDGFESGSRYNANGFDLNRDFPDQYTDANNSISGRQPETQAVMQWTWNHHFVLSANMHGGALVANYPFDGPTYDYSASPDDELFIQLARAYADAHPNMEAGGFTDGITNGADWYPIFGGMQDWNYIWEGDFDITLEQHEIKWPAANQLAGLWEEHREPMLAYIEEINNGVRGLVTTNNDIPLAATITVEDIDHEITTDDENGDYYRLLTPGDYTIVANAIDFLSQEETVTVPQTGYVELNFEMTPTQCTHGEMNHDNPCEPKECINGEWVHMIIDCAEQTGIPCYGGEYIPPDAGECCSVCTCHTLIGDLDNNDTINILDIIAMVNIVLNPNPNDSYDCLHIIDINDDSSIDVLDITQLVDAILNPSREDDDTSDFDIF